MSGDSAPMLADIDPIHRADRLKVVAQLTQEFVKETLFHRTGRCRTNQHCRTSLPATGTPEGIVHDLVKTAHPEVNTGSITARLTTDVLAAEVHMLFKVFAATRGCKTGLTQG